LGKVWYYPSPVLTKLRAQDQAGPIDVLVELRDLDPFGDDAHQKPAFRFGGLHDRWKDDENVIFNSAI
jgi:hypothetical protein